MIRDVDDIVDTLPQQILLGKLQKLFYVLRDKVHNTLLVYEEQESMKGLKQHQA